MSSPEVSTNIATPFAPVFWGFVVSLLFGGVSIVQGYIYFLHAKDQIMIKLLAAAMLILDLVDSSLVAYSMYYYLIPHFGSVTSINVITREMAMECLTATIITSLSQLYFVYQLVGAKRLGKGSWVIIWAITSLCFLALAGGVACVATMTMFRENVTGEDRNRSFEIAFGISKGLGAATDILATIAMCLFLASIRTGMKQTNSVLSELVRLIINRGILVTTVQSLLLITFYAAPKSLIWMAFHINLPKLYVNTFFAMLNGREQLKKKHFPHNSIRLNDVESSSDHGKSGPLRLGEQSTLVSQSRQEKDGFGSNSILMSTVVTTSVI